MLKTYLYIPEQLDDKIKRTAKNQKKSKAEIMRVALNEGLEKINKQNSGGAEVLLKLSDLAKKYKVRGPKDASINLDYYLWGLPRKKPQNK